MRQLLAIFPKPNEPFVKAGQHLESFVLEYFNCDERQQANQRAHFKGHTGVIEPDFVIIETVLLVPETSASERVDGVGDLDKMLEKLRSHVLIGRINFPVNMRE